MPGEKPVLRFGATTRDFLVTADNVQAHAASRYLLEQIGKKAERHDVVSHDQLKVFASCYPEDTPEEEERPKHWTGVIRNDVKGNARD